MARDLSGLSSEINQAVVYPVILVEIVTDVDTTRLWSGIGDLTFSGDVYTGAGDLGKITPIEERAEEVRANGVSMQVSGIAAADVTRALTANYRNRSAKVWLGFFDSETSSLISAFQLFGGISDVVGIDEGADKATISLTAESRLVDLERQRIRRYTNSDQTEEFPNDRGLEYIPAVQNVKFKWGD